VSPFEEDLLTVGAILLVALILLVAFLITR